MLARLLIFLGVALVLFPPFNILTYRQLVRIHPRRRRLVIAGVVIGNLLWPFFVAARSFTPFGRAIRAILGPPWLLFGRRRTFRSRISRRRFPIRERGTCRRN